VLIGAHVTNSPPNAVSKVMGMGDERREIARQLVKQLVSAFPR
jgi:hypothetical protein